MIELCGDNLTKGNLRKQLLKYVLSSIAAMWVFTLYTMVDGMFVARGVGPDALAAVNLSMPFINFSFGLSILLGIGASTRASVYRGQRKHDEADKIFTMSVIGVAAVSLFVTAVALLNLERLAYFLGATEVTLQYVKHYLGILLIFIPFYMTGYILEVMVKADGFPHKAIFYPLAGAVANIGLDYVFIFHFHWGIAGAAWATGASQVLSFVLFLEHFLGRKSGFSFVKVKVKIHELLKTAKLGISDCVTEFSIALATFMFNHVLTRTSGEEGVVVFTVISYVSQLILMTMVGLNQGMQPLVSYYFGRGEERAKRYLFRLAMRVAAVFAVLACVAGILYPDPVVAAFIDPSKEPEMFAHGVAAFKMYAPAFLPLGAVVVISGYFTAVELPKQAMTISIARGAVFVVVALLILSTIFGENGVWITMTVSETCSLILAVALLLRYKRAGDTRVAEA